MSNEEREAGKQGGREGEREAGREGKRKRGRQGARQTGREGAWWEAGEGGRYWWVDEWMQFLHDNNFQRRAYNRVYLPANMQVQMHAIKFR